LDRIKAQAGTPEVLALLKEAVAATGTGEVKREFFKVIIAPPDLVSLSYSESASVPFMGSDEVTGMGKREWGWTIIYGKGGLSTKAGNECQRPSTSMTQRVDRGPRRELLRLLTRCHVSLSPSLALPFSLLARLGPQAIFPFPLDDFQLAALDALGGRENVVVSAPTGSGKQKRVKGDTRRIAEGLGPVMPLLLPPRSSMTPVRAW
jgi:hypothetical protein